MTKLSLLTIVSLAATLVNSVYSDDLPTNYEYFTDGGITSGLSADQKYFQLNGRNITIFGGTFHYFRVHNSQWRDRLRKMRAAGLNAVETYVAWNLHEFYSGSYDFGDGGTDFQDFLNVEDFIKIAQEEDLFVLLRPGPYICAEWEFGGLPAWLLREEGIKVRTNDPVYIKYVSRYYKELFSRLAPLQFTNGGSIFAVQIENEYGNTGNHDPDYLHSLMKILKENGVKELLYTSDPPGAGTNGALPNEILMTANFNTDASNNLNRLDSYQTNKPTMTMEYWSGWFDHFTETHSTVTVEKYKSVYEEIITYPSSVNIYMFVGSTNYGFTAGANDLYGGLDNHGLQPTTTSYDYDAPISESGEIIDKFNATAELIAKYNPVKTRLPEVPETLSRVVFDDIELNEQILLSEIIDDYPDKIESENVISMEKLPINNNSGQNFGYIVYRKKLNIKANAVLKISGYVRDHVLVLVNGKLLNPVLSSVDDVNNFGYWRVQDSTITLTEEDLEDATLDLVVENNSRNNFGSLDQFQQFKGLIDDVFVNDEALRNFQIIPLEFKKSWNRKLSGWHDIKTREATPALYRGTFEVSSPLADTYINVQDWRKGIVIINGFVLGRIFAVGPQQALYLPAGLLQEGTNEVIIFEHFTAPEVLKFSEGPIWGKGTYIN